MSTYLYSMSRKKEKEIVRGVTVESVGAEGKAVARIDGKVVFMSNAVPGEIHGGHFGWDSDSLAGPSAALLRALSGLRVLCLAGTPLPCSSSTSSRSWTSSPASGIWTIFTESKAGWSHCASTHCKAASSIFSVNISADVYFPLMIILPIIARLLRQ